eukprot:TRINITY_DN22652_c0_g1_i1.p1 TRINITY_DN22652_c0_g1~~TRINITY_DN22652_c0_g1_i1.p1  ORF type:complete len:576 (+),score=93.02 TRINITY_DN22652_c0_g1_i1:49-1776(+)
MDGLFRMGGALPLLDEDGELDYEAAKKREEGEFKKQYKPAEVQLEASDVMCRVGVAESIGSRDKMEDAFVSLTDRAYNVFGVFDGHGGSTCSKYISEYFTNNITDSTVPKTDGEIEEFCLSADMAFLKAAGGDTGAITDFSGSTGTFVILRQASGGFHVKVGNVGDSRVLVSKANKAIPMTTDHKPELPAETSRIKEAGGYVVRNRVKGQLAVSRSFGDTIFKDEDKDPHKSMITAVPTITETKLSPGDIIILCCDGIYEPVSMDDERVLSIVRDSLEKDKKNCGKAAEALVNAALADGSTDNCSAIVVQLKGSITPPASPLPGPAGSPARGRPESPLSASVPVLYKATPESQLHLLLLERTAKESFGFSLTTNPKDEWSRIGSVVPGGPACRAWMRVGMHIVAIAGRPVGNRETFQRILRQVEQEDPSVPVMIRAESSLWAKVRRDQISKVTNRAPRINNKPTVTDRSTSKRRTRRAKSSRATSQPRSGHPSYVSRTGKMSILAGGGGYTSYGSPFTRRDSAQTFERKDSRKRSTTSITTPNGTPITRSDSNPSLSTITRVASGRIKKGSRAFR